MNRKLKVFLTITIILNMIPLTVLASYGDDPTIALNGKEYLRQPYELNGDLIEVVNDHNSYLIGGFPGHIGLFKNRVPIITDTEPRIENERVIVPIRSIIEALGGKVTWNKESQQIEIHHNNKFICLKINKPKATTYNMRNGKLIDEKKINLDASPKIINNRTFLPVRFISEELGYKVYWDSVFRHVRILDNSK